MAESSPHRGTGPIPPDYMEALGAIKRCIGDGRQRAALAANSALVLLYWDIGSIILGRQSAAGWGAGVIDRLSSDLSRTYPGVRGFSSRNLKYMRSFAAAWPDQAIVQQLAAQLPWHHNCLIIHKIRAPDLRAWYVRQAVREGWSRSQLAKHIMSSLHTRQGKALNNFAAALGPGASDVAEQVLKDPYLFDFLGGARGWREREVEQALVDHLQQFLIELGTGFAFVGRQVVVRLGRT